MEFYYIIKSTILDKKSLDRKGRYKEVQSNIQIDRTNIKGMINDKDDDYDYWRSDKEREDSELEFFLESNLEADIKKGKEKYKAIVQYEEITQKEYLFLKRSKLLDIYSYEDSI